MPNLIIMHFHKFRYWKIIPEQHFIKNAVYSKLILCQKIVITKNTVTFDQIRYMETTPNSP